MKEVFIVVNDWAVEDGADWNFEVFSTYKNALKHFEELIANEKRPEISWAAEYFDKDGNYIVDNEEAEFEEIIQEHYLTEDITGKYLEGKATIRTWEIYMKEESYIHTTLTIQRVLVR